MSIGDLVRRKRRHLGIRALLSTRPSSIAIYLLLTRWLGVIDRAELKRIASQRDALWEYGRRERVDLTSRTGCPVPEPFEPVADTYEIDRPFVCELTGCRLVGSPTPLGIASDGRVILETAKANQNEAMHRVRQVVESDGWLGVSGAFSANGGRSRDSEPEYDVVFPLAKRPGFSYYHWLTEYLPKVQALEQYEAQTGREPLVLVERDPPGWLKESLELAGVPFDRCVEWDSRTASARRLVIGAHREKSRGEFLHPATDDYRWLRDRVLTNARSRSIGEVTLSDRIYISRRNTRQRRVLNEDAVLDRLEPMGFVSYALEELSVAAQARLFAQAEVIVGPHGAGSTNIIFADESATLIDLINEKHLDPGPHLAYYYFVIAKQLGIGHDYLACEPRGTDMIVDVDALESLVQSVLAGGAGSG